MDALDQAGREDPATGEWVVDLSQHYDALDACNRGVRAEQFLLGRR